MLETSSIGKNSEDLQLLSMPSVSSSSSNLISMEAVPSPPPPPETTGKRERRHSPAAFNFQTTATVEQQSMSPSSSLSGGDATFEPTIDMMVNDFDDEQTLNEEESLANLEALNPEDEIATLKEESEMPLSELLAKYGALPPPPPPIESARPSTRKRRRRHSSNKRKLEQTKSEGIEETLELLPQSPPTQEQTAEDLNNQNETASICLGSNEENHTKPDLNTNDLEEEMVASTSEEVAPAEIASHQQDVNKTKRSHLLDLYPDECCFEESTTTKHQDEKNYDLPLEMLYDDVDDEEEEDEDADAEDVRKTIMIGISYQADIPDGLSQYGDDVLPYENEDKLLWEPCQVAEHQVEEYLLKVNEIKQPTTDDEEQQPPLLTNEGEPKDTEEPSCSDEVNMDKVKAPINETQNDTKLSSNNVNTESDSSGVPSVVKDNEQALHLLVQCGYDFKEALRRKRLNVLPLSDCMSSWSEDECVKFEEGIQKFGKDFLRIRQHLVRTRTMREMVQFYYLWKKSERRDQSCANADTIDQMDVYLNESGGDIVGCSSNAMQNGSGSGPSTANSSSQSIENKKLQAKNYSIMMIGSQSNCSSSTENSETSTPLVTTPLSSTISSRKRIAVEQDNNDANCSKNDSSN